MSTKVAEVADSTKVRHGMISDNDCRKSVLIKLSTWFEKWLIEINVDKCKIVDFG